MTEVSILMSVFNGELFLRRCLESVISQTHRNWEFIIIDDGSTDKSAEIVREYMSNDSRISLVTKINNRGLPIRLNESIELAKGKFLARMDADDEMAPERLENQVRFLKMNPDIGVLGSVASLVDKNGRNVGEVRLPEFHDAIRKLMPYKNPLVHSTTMMHREVVQGTRYSASLQRCQDYDLWSRLVDSTRMHNLQEPLMRYHIDYREKTWRAIKYDFFVHYIVICRLRSISALAHPLVLLVRNVAVKYGIYLPISLRS